MPSVPAACGSSSAPSSTRLATARRAVPSASSRRASRAPDARRRASRAAVSVHTAVDERPPGPNRRTRRERHLELQRRELVDRSRARRATAPRACAAARRGRCTGRRRALDRRRRTGPPGSARRRPSGRRRRDRDGSRPAWTRPRRPGVHVGRDHATAVVAGRRDELGHRGRLPAGAAATSRTTSPGSGATYRITAWLPWSWGVARPCATGGSAAGSPAARTTSASGTSRPASTRAPPDSSSARRSSTFVRSGFGRSVSAPGSFACGEHAARVTLAEVRAQAGDQPVGVRQRDGLVVGLGPRRAEAAQRAQHGVDVAAALAPAPRPPSRPTAACAGTPSRSWCAPTRSAARTGGSSDASRRRLTRSRRSSRRRWARSVP